MKACFYQRTNIGLIRIEEENEIITALNFENSLPEEEEVEVVETACLHEAFRQLKEYLSGNRMEFNLPLYIQGTEFQMDAWEALRKIPYGQTRSYKQQAEAIGRPKAVRAIGMANHHNPIAIFIPCHRVLGANGKLVGFGGGLDVKIKLLELEKETLEKQSGRNSD